MKDIRKTGVCKYQKRKGLREGVVREFAGIFRRRGLWKGEEAPGAQSMVARDIYFVNSIN